MDLSDTEARFVKSLQGKRLICEVDVSQQEIDELKKEVSRYRSLLWNLYPSITAVTTVYTGIYEYHQGDFWSAFPELNGPITQSKWGERFERYLEKHDSLETFQELKRTGHRYISPILAHGGMPQYCLADFFDLMARYGDPDQPGSELIDFLRQHPNAMVNIDKPVQRFLLNGGEVAEEFVARCLAVWQSRERGDGGGTHGLPTRVIEGFTKWYVDHNSASSNKVRYFSKPEIRIKPGDLWVYLYLPRIDGHADLNPSDCWEIDQKIWAMSRSHEIPLERKEYWTVGCKKHEVKLQGISDTNPALFFDAISGKSIPNPRLRRLPERLWVVTKQTSTIHPEPAYREVIPTWPEYVIAVFNLEGQKYLKVADQQFEVRRPFFHVEQDPVVSGAASDGGLAIFYMPPRIEWEGTANLSLFRGDINEGNIDITSDDFLMWFDEPGEYEFILRGPFGQNVRKHFVLIHGFKITLQPAVIWPDSTRVRCDVSSDHAAFCSIAGLPPPFVSCSHSIAFQAMFEETVINLIAKVPRLRWRIVMSNDEVPEWGTEEISLSLDQLEQASYPRLICQIGHLTDEIDMTLIGNHGLIQPPKRHRSVNLSEKNTLEFDLRIVLDQMRESGKAEEFSIWVKGSEGVQLYSGTIFAVRPYWDLHAFHAVWKNRDGVQRINVTWQERGQVLAGRWLVLMPIWRPWENAIHQHQLSDEERATFEWVLSDLRPGRYILRAIHAPWGCEDWRKSHHTIQKVIDVNSETWPEVFALQPEPSVESYVEGLLAHWYRPQQITSPPLPPKGLLPSQIQQFLESIEQANNLLSLQIPRDGSGSLNIFCVNPNATTKVVDSMADVPEIWKKVLPSLEIVQLIPNQRDKDFIHEIAFQYTVLETAARSVKQRNRQRLLSDPMKQWHRQLIQTNPPPDEVIFLCEKFGLFENASPAVRREYDKLKQIFQIREAI